jgi:ABC-type transport system involved in multi-copper enzyme maturation permease subunit
MSQLQRKYLLLLLASILFIVSLNLFFPGLRFEYGLLNYLVYSVVYISIPVLLFLIGASSTRYWAQVIIIIIAIITALPTGVISYNALSRAYKIVSTGSDQSLYLLASVEHAGSNYRLYRTNHNPLKAYGLILRKETHLLPGLKYVKQINGFYGTREGTITIKSNGYGQVVTTPYHSSVKVQVYEFKL